MPAEGDIAAAAGRLVRRQRHRAADGDAGARRCAPRAREVVLSNGASLAYDRLVLATGSSAVRLPIPGRDLPGVLTFRDCEDVAAMQRARPGAPVVVIGGGLLGVEAAYGLARRGCKVDAAARHAAPDGAPARCARRGAARGGGPGARASRWCCEAQTAAIEGDGRAERVVLKDGRAYPGRAGGDGGRHPAGHGAGRERRPRDRPRHQGRRHVRRPARPASTPSANAPSIAAPAAAWSSRPTSRPRCSPATSPACPRATRARCSAASLKVSGVPVFSMGDFEGEGAETILLEDAGSRRLPQARRPRRPAGRRRAVRRHRRRALVPRPDPPAGARSRRSAPRSPSAGPTRRPPDERAGLHARSSAAISRASSRACRRAAPRRA